MSIRNLLWLLLFFTTIGLPNAFAAELSADNPENYQQRTDFIELSLKESAQHARYWQNGWTTFYAASALAQTVLWIDTDKNDDSVNYGIGALKSVGGLADMLLRPHPGRHGVEPLLGMPEQSRQRLEQGEVILMDSAARAASRRSWQPHLKMIGVNLLGGALIAAFGDEEDALVSTALGIAIGEANIWTQPTRAEADWKQYQQNFPGAGSRGELSWRLVPMVGGIALQGQF